MPNKYLILALFLLVSCGAGPFEVPDGAASVGEFLELIEGRDYYEALVWGVVSYVKDCPPCPADANCKTCFRYFNLSNGGTIRVNDYGVDVKQGQSRAFVIVYERLPAPGDCIMSDDGCFIARTDDWQSELRALSYDCCGGDIADQCFRYHIDFQNKTITKYREGHFGDVTEMVQLGFSSEYDYRVRLALDDALAVTPYDKACGGYKTIVIGEETCTVTAYDYETITTYNLGYEQCAVHGQFSKMIMYFELSEYCTSHFPAEYILYRGEYIEGRDCLMYFPEQCDVIVDTLEEMMRIINYCDSAADCTASAGFGCPFSCYHLHNKEVNISLVPWMGGHFRTKTLVDLYDNYPCQKCEQRCPSLPDTFDCVEGRCIVV